MVGRSVRKIDWFDQTSLLQIDQQRLSDLGRTRGSILDVEITLNNRPLGYIEDDDQVPLLAPNAMQFGLPNVLPEQEDHRVEESDLRRRARGVRYCKEVLWKRWQTEYLRALRERHNMKHNGKMANISIGDVEIIKGEEKNRCKWKFGIMERLVTGSDCVVRGAKLRIGKSTIERLLQLL